jgi:hypothetical protein
VTARGFSVGSPKQRKMYLSVIIIINFMQDIYSYIPETDHDSMVYIG